MSRSKKPAAIVAAVLLALIVVPSLLVWQAGRAGSGADGGASGEVGGASGNGAAGGPESAEFDLRRLSEETEALLQGKIAEALQNGDVSLDFVAELQSGAERAREAMGRGRKAEAAELFRGVLERGRAKLDALELAEKARSRKETVYAELERLEKLRGAFAETYGEAVDRYDRAVKSLDAGEFAAAVEGLEKAAKILEDLEQRAEREVKRLTEAAREALEAGDTESAGRALEKAREIDADHPAVREGLASLEAAQAVADRLGKARELEAEGKLEAALAELERIAGEAPDNAFVRGRMEALRERIAGREIKRLVERADTAEAAGDLEKAIAALESALELRKDKGLSERLNSLRERHKRERLETLLEDGYAALQASRYEAARDLYKKAAALAPDSKEAAKGLEKASTLHLAQIRYEENLESAEKYIEAGRFPLAKKFFNRAMGSRPGRVSAALAKREDRLREELRGQSGKVPLVLESDNRTYVSMIGVFPPERFREKKLNLYPDVYTVRGTRKGYADVEKEIKVNADKPGRTIEIEAGPKQ